MKKTLRTMLAEIFANRARRRKLTALVGVLSVLVFTGVFWQLMQPVITMTAGVICGMDEHSHASACYASKQICGEEESEAHAHASACFESVLVCSEAEHSHSEKCYPEKIAESTVEPTAPAVEPTAEAAAAAIDAEPTVTPEVTEEAEATAIPEATEEAEATATPEATEEAEATATPEATEEAEATATPEVTEEVEAEATIAPEVSAEPSVEPSVEPEEGLPAVNLSAQAAYVLAGETAVWNYDIADAESAAYVISHDGSTVSEGALEETCGSIAWTAEVPGEYIATVTAKNEIGENGASAAVYAAEKLELNVECSALSCFDGDTVRFTIAARGGAEPVAYSIRVIQGASVIEEYTEYVESIDVTAQTGGRVSTLTLEAEATDAFGNTISACSSIPVAVDERESAAAWASSARTELSGVWAEDLIRVAKTQLGYRESEINFVVREDGSRQGYTRYGDWYGLPYEEWCAMFASFCLNYADIPEADIPRNAGCARWIGGLRERGLYEPAGNYMPEAGDLIFFDWEHDGHSDHVGIVTDVSESTVTTIEGNSSRSVRVQSYSINDRDIMGYGTINRAYEAFHPEQSDDLNDDLPENEGEEPVIGEDLIAADGKLSEPGEDLIAADEELSEPGEDLIVIDEEISISEEDIPVSADVTAGAESLRLEIWIEEGMDGAVICMSAVADGIDAECYNWQWQTAETEDGEWTDIPGAEDLECRLPLTEENCGRYYRICGTYCEPVEIPMVYSLRAMPAAEETDSGDAEDKPAAYLASRAISPSTRGITAGDSELTIDVYFVNEETGEVNSYVAEKVVQSNYNAINSSKAIFEELKASADDAALRDGSYVRTYLATGVGATDKIANYFKCRYYFQLHYAEYEDSFSNYYISNSGDANFYDYGLYIHYTPAEISAINVSFFRNDDCSEDAKVAEYTLDPGMTLADVGAVLPEDQEDPSGMGREFLGWYYIDENGDEVQLTQDDISVVAFNEDTAVYALYSALQFTVTFVDTEGEVFEGHSYTISEGEMIGSLFEDWELPWPPYDETGEFEYYWYYTDENGEEVEAFADMEVYSDLVIYPKALSMYSLYIYDIDPDGQPVLPEADPDVEVEDISIYIAEGDIVSYYFYDAFQDGTNYTDIRVWYSEDENGNLQPFDPDEPMPAHDLYLYTYSYRLTLEREDDADGEALEIIGREGMPLAASDFVVDDVYYRTYSWKLNDGSETAVDLESLIANGLTENVSARGSRTAMPYEQGTVNFYVFVNEERKLVESKAVDRYTFSDSGSRRFINVFTAESIYEEYGFRAGMINSTQNFFFPHTDVGSGTLWPESFKQVNGIWYIPIVNHNGGADLYYLPKGTASSGNFSQESVRLNNTFYTVTVEDPAGRVYWDEADIPPVHYVLNGDTAEITVWMADPEYSSGWYILDDNGAMVDFTAEDDYDYGLTTLIVENVSSPLFIMPGLAEDEFYVSYDINLNSYILSDLSAVPNIMGSDSYTEMSDGEVYDVFAPANPSFWVTAGTSLKLYEFAGWSVSGSTMVIPTGEIDAETLKAYEVDGTVSLRAKWTEKTNTAKVNFYVNRACRVLNADGTEGSNIQNNMFTSAVYAASVSVENEAHFRENWSPRVPAYSGVELVVIQGKSTTDTAAADKEIRGLASESYMATSESADGTTYAIGLSSFPSDEFVFEQLREMQQTAINNNDTSEQITLNDVAIPVKDLNSTNFTIRWYVFKYTEADAHWHIDGVLVNKQGQLTVKKTFYGDEAAVEDVKNDYSITLTKAGDSTPVYTLGLSDTDTDTMTGYDYYDAATDTYTWVITVQQNAAYNVKEQNYQAQSSYNGVSVATLAEYNIRNSDESTGGKWLTYYAGNGVSVSAKAYASDIDYTSYQTLTFLNSYIPTNTMIVRKVDSVTGTGIADVSFTLKKDDVVQNVWLGENDRYYIYDPVNEGITAEKIADGTITTDAAGNLVLIGLKDANYAGNYSLTEQAAPDGYNLIYDEIGFTVGANGAITITSGASHAEMDDSGMTMRIKNTPRSTQLIVEKYWMDEADAKPVTFQLYRNGASMGTAYNVVLDGTEDTPWTHTWNDLPLFINGEAAAYAVRETWIGLPNAGGAAYDPSADTDGYADYVVTHHEIEYRFPDGSSDTSPTRVVNGETEYAQMAILAVENDLVRGQLIFDKVDADGNALRGAEFSIYKNAMDETPIATARSYRSGQVTFNLDAGTYYMRETAAPDGYMDNDTLYMVTISGAGAKIRYLEDDVWTEIADGKIVNIRNVDVTVAKTDGIGRPLSGAIFRISDEYGPYLHDGANSAFAPDTSFTLEALPDGVYSIEETSAPIGYYKISGQITFAVEEGSITVLELPEGVEFDADTGTFTVANVPGSVLPETGGMGTAWFTAVGAALMVLSLFAGLRIVVKRKRSNSGPQE